MRLLLGWAINALSLMALTWLVPAIRISGFGTALVAALVKTQGQQRFSEQVLTGSSGFAGIDGIFRFKADGTNERGLAVLEMNVAGPVGVSPAPTTFLQPGF